MDPAESSTPKCPDTLTEMLQLANFSWRNADSLSNAEIYLSDSLNSESIDFLRKRGLDLPPDFLRLHDQDTIAAWDVPPIATTALFAKWMAPETQLREQWDIEQRIARNTPYNVDTIRDPSHLRLNHTRYERDPPLPARPYHPVTGLDLASKEIMQASTECVSICLQRAKGVMIGLILFDPPRFHKLTIKKYDFWSDTAVADAVDHERVFLNKQTCRERFVETLAKTTTTSCSTGDDTMKALYDALIEIILEDERIVLAAINRSLDSIDISLASNEFLYRTVDVWRDQFGRWRNLLFHAQKSIEYISAIHGQAQPVDCAQSTVSIGLGNIRDCLGSTADRVDSTFQAFGLTISIVKSEKAIRQAETVAKLTRLAFFFVPPTLMTGVFGANINEFNGKLTLWHWALASLFLSLLTYLVFYRHQVLRLLVGSAHALADTSLSRLSNLAIRWLTITRATWRAAPKHLVRALWLGLHCVIFLCFWQVIKSPIAQEAKLVVSLAFLSGYTGAAVIPLILRSQRERRYSKFIIMIVAAILVVSGMEVAVWKVLTSQMTWPAKTALSSGILCLSALSLAASRFLASRQRARDSLTLPGGCGSI